MVCYLPYYRKRPWTWTIRTDMTPDWPCDACHVDRVDYQDGYDPRLTLRCMSCWQSGLSGRIWSQTDLAMHAMLTEWTIRTDMTPDWPCEACHVDRVDYQDGYDPRLTLRCMSCWQSGLSGRIWPQTDLAMHVMLTEWTIRTDMTPDWPCDACHVDRVDYQDGYDPRLTLRCMSCWQSGLSGRIWPQTDLAMHVMLTEWTIRTDMTPDWPCDACHVDRVDYQDGYDPRLTLRCMSCWQSGLSGRIWPQTDLAMHVMLTEWTIRTDMTPDWPCDACHGHIVDYQDGYDPRLTLRCMSWSHSGLSGRIWSQTDLAVHVMFTQRREHKQHVALHLDIYLILTADTLLLHQSQDAYRERE